MVVALCPTLMPADPSDQPCLKSRRLNQSESVTMITDLVEPESNILQLPDVISRDILGRLDLNSLIDIRFTCRSIYHHIEQILDQIIGYELLHSVSIDTLFKVLKYLSKSTVRKSYFLKLFREAPPEKIVILYDRIMAMDRCQQQRIDLVKILYDLIDDDEFHQLIDVLRVRGRWRPIQSFFSLSSPANSDWEPDPHHLSILQSIIPDTIYQHLSVLLTNPACFSGFVMDVFLEHDRADLISDPSILLTLLRCGTRFDMFNFLYRIDIDIARLQDILPLLTGSFWDDNDRSNNGSNRGAWRFYQNIIRLHGVGRDHIVDALLRLPFVNDICHACMGLLIPQLDTSGVQQLLKFNHPLINEIVNHRFGPDHDQYLHWFCKQGDLRMIQLVSDIADFHSRNGRGVVPFRYLSWSQFYIERLFRDYPNLVKIFLQSDPGFISSPNSEITTPEMFQQAIADTDFVEVLLATISGCDTDRLRSLFSNLVSQVRLNRAEVPLPTALLLIKRHVGQDPYSHDDRHVVRTINRCRDYVASIINRPDSKDRSTLLHYAFSRSNAGIVKTLMSMAGINIYATDLAGRVPFQYATQGMLIKMLNEFPPSMVQDLVRSHIFTFIRLVKNILICKKHRHRIQPIFANVHLFKICAPLPA